MFGYWRNRNLFFSILTIILCGACSHCIASGSKQTVREKKRNVRLVPYGGSSGSGWEETSSTGQKTIGKSTTKHRSWSSITKPNKESDLITGPEEIGYFKFNETFIASSRQKKRPVVILASDTSNNTSHNGQDTFTVEQDEIVTESKARQEEPKDAIGQFHSRSLEELEDFIEYILQSWIKFDTDEIFADIRSIHGEKSDSLIKELSKKILPSIAARNERALLLISEIQEKEGLKSIFDDYIMEKFKGKRVSGEKEGVSGKITYRSFVSTTIFLLSSSDQEKSEKIHNFLTSMFEPANGKIGRYALENTVFQFFVRRLHDKEEYVPIIDFIYKKINSNRSRDLSIKKILGTFEKYGWGCKKAQDATIDYIKDLVVNMDGMSSLISGVSLHLFSYKCINILVNGNYKCVNALIDENHHHGSDNIGYRLSIDHMSQIAKLFDAISLDFIKTIDILRDLFRKLVFLDDRFASKIISTLETTFSKIKKDVDSVV